MATLKFFIRGVFNVEELTDDLGDQIQFNPDGTSLPSGTYMLYLRDILTRDEKWNVTFELWYISMDGRQHGRLLSMSGNVNLISVTRDPLDRRLMLAQVSEDLVKTWIIDWEEATVEGYVASGIRGLSKEPKYPYLKVSPQSAYAFSPDGHWLVWDCEPEGVSAYCLLDLEEGGGIAVYPEGENIEQDRVPSYYGWSPNSEWFLALCNTRLVNPNWKGGRCLVWTEICLIEWQKTIDRIEDRVRVSFVRRHSIAPDGEHLFIVTYPNFNKGEETSHLIVIDRLCIVEGTCTEKLRFEFSPGGGWEAIWSFSGDLLALSYSPDTLPSSLAPGPATLVILDVARGSSHVVADHLGNGARVIGWSPDGKWIAMYCGDRHPYAVCALSTNGFFRPLVLDYEGSRQEFLGWLVVP